MGKLTRNEEEALNTFLSSAQESLRERYREFAREKVEAFARALDQHSVSLKEFLQGLGRSGYLGMTVPQEFGGEGAPFLNLVLFVEAIAQYDAGLGLTLAAHTVAIELIKTYGTDQLKSRYLPLLAGGEVVGSWAVSEESAGTDFEAARCLAFRGESQLSLIGKKTWVVNAELAGLLVVLARLADKESAEGGELALVIVDLSGGDQVHVSSNREKLGLRSAYTNDVEFKNLKLPEENLLPAPRGAAEQVLYGMDITKVIVAASAIGLTDSALNQAVNHACSRQQFGKKIGQFQGVQWKIADHCVEDAGARLQTYRAAWSKDESPTEFRKYAAMCKWFAARAARLHSGEALQILGAAGVSCDSSLEKLYRDAKVMEICEGTSEFQKVLLAKALDI